MPFKPGKLYKCPKYFLLIFPTKEKVMSSDCPEPSKWTTRSTANYWSKELNCKIYYSEPGEIFIFLEEQKKNVGGKVVAFLHVLFGDKQGWISFRDWMGITNAF